MFGLGIQELMIILAIAVLLFGARRLPEIGSGIGEAIRNFKSGMSDEKKEIDAMDDQEMESFSNYYTVGFQKATPGFDGAE
jgi:sec-independent protein translocase protein TatA